MADDGEAFVSRWSRRKRDARIEEEAKPSVPVTPAPETDPPEGAAAKGDPAEGDPEVVAALPDIESLDETSDFTPFMAKGVPEVLRRRALRKLWRLNPLFAQLDGLNDYDEDFTDAAALLAEIKTVYKVGKGMVSEPAPEEETAPQETEETGPEAEDMVERSADDPAVVLEAPADPTVSAKTAGESEAEQRDDGAPTPGDEGRAAAAAPDERSRRSAAARRWGESPG